MVSHERATTPAPAASGGFVVLHHRTADGEHWDVMLEHHGVLMTWQLGAEPTGRRVLPLRARRIADHRLAYLTYEGPISRDRGTVRRVDAGGVSIEEVRADRVAFTLVGARLAGRFTLNRVGGAAPPDQWMLSARPDGP